MGLSKALSSRAVRGEFFWQLEERTRALWLPLVSDVFASDQDIETYKFLGPVPPLAKWRGQRPKKEPGVEKIAVTNEIFTSALEFDVDDMRRDKTGQVLRRIGELSGKVASLPQKVVSDLINGELTPATKSYDGINFFGDHSTSTRGTKLNNIPTAINATDHKNPTVAEMITGVNLGVKTLLGATDVEGEPAHDGILEIAVVVPSDFAIPVSGAIRDLYQASGTSNTLQSMIAAGELRARAVVNNRLTNPDATNGYFYVVRSNGPVKPFMWQDELETQFDELSGSDYEFFNNRRVFGVKRIGNAAFGEHGMIVRVQFN